MTDRVAPTVRRAAVAELSFPLHERAATAVDPETARDAGEYLRAVLDAGRDPMQALDMVRYVFDFGTAADSAVDRDS